MRHTPTIMAVTWLLTCWVMILAGQFVTLAPAEQAVAWPRLPVGGDRLIAATQDPGVRFLPPVTLVVVVLVALLLYVSTSRARTPRARRPWTELILFYPLLFAYLWLVAPARDMAPAGWVLGAAILGATAWMMRRSPERSGENYRLTPRIRLLDGLLVAVPIIVGLLSGPADLSARQLVYLLLYPLYALLQLVVFLVIPAGRWRQLGLSDRAIAVCCAVAFSLIHWPNPLVMVVTGCVLVVLASQYLAGRPLYQVAAVLGIAAVAFSQFLPDPWTRHMRVGPGYVRNEVTAQLSHWPGVGPAAPATFLYAVYPALVGRDATEAESGAWARSLKLAKRTTMAWQFYTSEEYARRSGEAADPERWPPPPPREIYWLDLDQQWYQRIAAYGTDDYWRRRGDGNLAGFTDALYADILHRQGNGAATGGWSYDLSPGQRKRIVEVLLEGRGQWAATPFTGLNVVQLRLPN